MVVIEVVALVVVDVVTKEVVVVLVVVVDVVKVEVVEDIRVALVKNRGYRECSEIESLSMKSSSLHTNDLYNKVHVASTLINILQAINLEKY